MIKFVPVIIKDSDTIRQAIESGRCDVLLNDVTDLTGYRSSLGDRQGDYLLPEVISKEPLGPLVRQGDWRWLSIIKWLHFTLVDAEDLGVTAANLVQSKQSTNPEIRRLLGVEGDLGTAGGDVLRVGRDLPAATARLGNQTALDAKRMKHWAHTFTRRDRTLRCDRLTAMYVSPDCSKPAAPG
jgi:hypothetical protein